MFHGISHRFMYVINYYYYFYLFLIFCWRWMSCHFFIQSPADINIILYSRIAGDYRRLSLFKGVMHSVNIFLVPSWSRAHYFVNGCIYFLFFALWQFSEMSLADVHPKRYLFYDILGRIIENRDMVRCVKIWFRLFSDRHDIIWMMIFSYFEKLRQILNMHIKDDPTSDMHAKNYLIIWCLEHLLGPSKFGPVFSGTVPSNTTPRCLVWL